MCGRLAYRLERVDVEGRPTDERAVDIGLREQRPRVVRLHGAAVENRRIDDRLDEGVRLLRGLGRRGVSGADRPDGLVRKDDIRVRLDYRELPAEHILGFAPATLPA